MMQVADLRPGEERDQGNGVSILVHRIQAIEPLRHDGQLGPANRRPAPEKIELRGTPPVAHFRSVDFDDMSCVLVVEAQGSEPFPPESDRTRFLRSLKRTGKPVW